MAAKRDYQGRIEGVNERGVKIDGDWYNWSKFYKGDKNPPKGVVVAVVLGEYQDREFVNELEVIGSALPNGGGNTPSTSSDGGSYASRSAETQLSIHRQVALKAAVAHNADNSEFGHSPADVVATARIFERFLNEPLGDTGVEDAA